MSGVVVLSCPTWKDEETEYPTFLGWSGLFLSAPVVNRMSGELGGGSDNVATSSGASSRYLVTPISTRRFLARPAAVLLLAIGSLSPWPAADKLLLTPPSRSA
jgi:hypothetical protein